MQVKYKDATKKPFMQKAYEKFVMVFYSVVRHGTKSKDFGGVLSVVIGKDSNGQNDCYLCVESKTGYMPIARFFHENDTKPDIDFEKSHQVSELFYKLMKVETRKTVEDFQEVHVMPEFVNLYPDAK